MKQIDLSKYDGHTEEPWIWFREDGYDILQHDTEHIVTTDDSAWGEYHPVIDVNSPDGLLIADAPMLLSHIRECYEEINCLLETLANIREKSK